MPRQDKMRRQSADAKFSRETGEEIDDGTVEFFQLDRYLATMPGTQAAVAELRRLIDCGSRDDEIA